MHGTGLLSEEQCKARDVRRKARQKTSKYPGSGGGGGGGGGTDMADSQQSPDSNTVSTPTAAAQAPKSDALPSTVANPLDYVSSEHRELIEKLVHYQEKFELPSEDDIRKISVSGAFGF